MNQKLLDKNKTKELDWEKEFVNEFCDPNDTDLINEYEESWRIKNFISNLLTQQRTELLEEIKGLQTYVLFNDTEKLISLEQVINLVKK